MKNLKLLLTLISFMFAVDGMAQNARLQVIHNSSDPTASQVDVYVNGTLLLDNFTFRAATPYIDVPAGVTLNIGIAGSGSSSVNDTLVNVPVVLTNGQTYVAIASGVLSPGSFASNPNSISTGFQLLLQDNMRETSVNSNEVDFRVLHGSTDAPTVDVLARNVATLVDNASYTDITNYISVPAASYILDITPGNDNSVIVASYIADLTLLSGGSAVVFASGFLDPAANQNGEAFGIFAALADGTVLSLPAVSQARLQVIHNSSDPAASQVDVYVNGTLLLDDFTFRAATPYIDVPAGVTLNIGIAGSGSSSVNDTLVNVPLVLTNGQTYVAIASGVLSPGSFASNPNSISTGFQLLLQDNMRETSVNSNEVDFRVLHGSTDAPTVDVVIPGVGVLVDNASYTDITPYISVQPLVYNLDITDDMNTITVASYLADLTSLSGGSALIFASGFLDPSANQNGEAFGLFAALPDGSVIPFSNSTGIFENESSIRIEAYPNPVRDNFVVYTGINSSEKTRVELFDMQGKKVYETETFNPDAITISMSSFKKGQYILRVANEAAIGSISLIKQ